MTKPSIRFKAGGCIASVFLNESANNERPVPRVSLQRVYRDKAGAFQYTSGLGARDLPNAILALWQTWTHLVAETKETEEQ